MAKNESRGNTGSAWRVPGVPPVRTASVVPAPNAQLSTDYLPDDRSVWRSAGSRARFVLDQHVMGHPLLAGWYELRIRVETVDGRMVLPSVCLRYASASALRDLELVLSSPGVSGRMDTLLLLLEPVASIEFAPSVEPVRFHVCEFRLRRVSRLRALRLMLRGGRRATPRARLLRLGAWLGGVWQRGPKRATDLLYAAYRRGMWPADTGKYAAWILKYDTIDANARTTLDRRAAALHSRRPLVSVLLVVGDVQESVFRVCLDALVAQAWQKWEAFVVSGAPDLAAVADRVATRDPRVRVIHTGRAGDHDAALNAALSAAQGDFSILMDGRCQLRPHALLRVVEEIAVAPHAQVVYWDDDLVDEHGQRSDPSFKPDWDPDLLRSRNYIGNTVVVSTSLARSLGGFRAGFGGACAYDLVLRCGERTTPTYIVHIAEVLAHKLKSTGADAQMSVEGTRAPSELRAVAEHLARTGARATAETVAATQLVRRIRWQLPAVPPKVSLIVPTRDRFRLLRRCVESILAKTTYPDIELVVVDNQSRQRASLAYLDGLAQRDRVRVLRYPAQFNYSAINNWAARRCSGQLLALVNNDIEVISPGWLEEMVSLALRADTGAVGAMLYYGDGTIQHAGMVLGVGGIAGHVYTGMPRGYPGYMQRARLVQGLSAVTGACLVVRRDLFETVGGLDERLPVEFNDVDFCLRLMARGYRNVWTPFAELYHHESASRSLASASAAKTRSEGIALMMKRWGAALRCDPAYNLNLSLHDLDCGLAFPPRERDEAQSL